MTPDQAALSRKEPSPSGGEVFGAADQAHQQVILRIVDPPQQIGLSDQVEGAGLLPLGAVHRPVSQPAVVAVAPIGQVRPGAGVCRRRSRGGGRGEQFHHPERSVVAAVDGVVPGVAAEEHRLAFGGQDRSPVSGLTRSISPSVTWSTSSAAKMVRLSWSG